MTAICKSGARALVPYGVGPTAHGVVKADWQLWVIRLCQQAVSNLVTWRCNKAFQIFGVETSKAHKPELGLRLGNDSNKVAEKRINLVRLYGAAEGRQGTVANRYALYCCMR